MQRIEGFFHAANRWALILMLGAMSLIIFANVALRYLTSESIVWAEEVGRHLMIWITFVGAGPVMRYGGHIAIENLQDGVPKSLAIALRLMVAVMLYGFFFFMIWFGIDYMQRTQYQLTAATQVSFAYIYAAIPVGGLLLVVHLTLILRDYVKLRVFASDAHFDTLASASL